VDDAQDGRFAVPRRLARAAVRRCDARATGRRALRSRCRRAVLKMAREPESEPELLRVLVEEQLAGQRADAAVLRSLPGFSRKEVKELFEAGRVRGAGRRLKKG